ncbi:GNAT family N-acetyltransferase [Kitasatospora sp. NPDC059571]|uniref:GNAT family N-acetyltransferase n=1 Tax=Kitasatospora sp. NPDC059571 TaxID=3346871 RepID=UPI0036BE222A
MSPPAGPPAVAADAVRAPGPRIHRTPQGLAPLEDGWRRLAAATPGSSYFATPDWVLAAWETMEPAVAAGAEAAVWTAPDGAVEAVLPLVLRRAALHPRLPLPVTAWTLLGEPDDAADHGILPVAPQRCAEAGRWLRQRTAGRSVWLPAMDPEADPALLPPGTFRVASVTCPRLVIGPDTEVGSRGFRATGRRRERQLADLGVSFRWIEPPAMTAQVLDTVLRLHRLRQEHKGVPTAFGPARRAFHLRLQHRAAPGRGPAALLAEHEGRAIGAVYGFRWGQTFAYYNGGWDPAYARLSLGTVLLNRTIATVADRGARVFDFLRGDEAYKYRSFGATDRHDVQWLRPRSPAALLSGAVLRHARRRRGTTRPADG